MFNSLSDRFSGIFEKLKRKALLSEKDVNEAMREIRIALLEADVALPVVKSFVETVKEQATGQQVLQSISPGQMVVKIVNDQLVKILGDETSELNLKTTPPAVIMMVGLQGSGKTTSTAKLANHIQAQHQKKVLMVSLDIYRPAAQQQLATLGNQTQIDHLPIVFGQQPVEITKRALDEARRGGHDVVILDTAGRLHVDEELMTELQNVSAVAHPIETFLVADAMTGQDAVEIAKSFKEKVDLSGVILTRMDGDARGGAALSLKETTQCPIKFIGVGEKISEFETFHPERVAGRILGMGDIVSLVEKASEQIEEEEAERLAKKMQKGTFDLEDFKSQLLQLQKMGGLSSLLPMIPGMGKLKKLMSEKTVDESIVKRQVAIISSMTLKERHHPELIKASRKKRIASGSGTQVQDVNKLLKQFLEMSKMMKKFGKMDKKSLMRSGFGNFLGQ